MRHGTSSHAAIPLASADAENTFRNLGVQMVMHLPKGMSVINIIKEQDIESRSTLNACEVKNINLKNNTQFLKKVQPYETARVSPVIGELSSAAPWKLDG